MIKLDIDQEGSKYLAFAKKKLAQLQRFVGVGVRNFSLPDAEITVRAIGQIGHIRIRSIVVSGDWWPALMQSSGGDWDAGLFIPPVKAIALSADSGETVTAVNATAISPKCVTTLKTTETLRASYRFTEEFVEWCFVNNHLQMLKELCLELMSGQTYSSGAVAPDFLHEFPSFSTLEALYFYRDTDGDVAGVFRAYPSSFDRGNGYAAVTANDGVSGNNIKFDVDCVDTGTFEVLAKEYIPWVVIKRKVIYGVGVEWGNAVGSVVLDKANPVYSFEAFGSTISIDLTNVQTAVSGLAVGDTFDTSGDPDAGENTGECQYEVYATGTVILDGGVEKLQATVYPIISIYRGTAWLYGSPPTVDDVYEGKPYSFGEFIDLRADAYPASPELVSSDYTGDSKSVRVTDLTGLSYEGEWLDCTIFGDLHNGVFGVVSHVEITEQNRGIGYAELVGQNYVEGFRYDEDGYASLTGTDAIVSDAVTTGIGDSPFDELYQSGVITQKIGLMDRTLATAFEGTFDSGYDLNTALMSWYEADIAVDAAVGNYSVPNQRLEATIAGPVYSVTGTEWRRGLTYSSPDMGIIANAADPGDGNPRVELLYEGSVVKSVATSFSEDMLPHAWQLNAPTYRMPFVNQLGTQSQLLGGVLSGFRYYGDFTLYQYEDMPSKSRAFNLNGASSTANINLTVLGNYELTHSPYMSDLSSRSDEDYEAYLAFIYWPNASGTDRGIVAVECWCGIELKKDLILWTHTNGVTAANFADFQTFVSDMMTEVSGYADPEPGFLDAVTDLFDYVDPIGTPTSEELASASALLLDTMRASYEVLVNNFAGPTLLDMALPEVTQVVASYTPETFLPELVE